MANIVEEGILKVKQSQFIFLDNGGFEVRDAYLLWTNFMGAVNQFGNATRNFNVAVTPEFGKLLLEKGWRVREKAPYDDEEGEHLYFVNIKINMDSSYPPLVNLYSEFKGKRTKRALDINTLGELDRIEMESCDFIVNPYKSDKFKGLVTGYLKKLNVIQEPNTDFGGKYDDWADDENDCMATNSCSLVDRYPEDE